MTTTLFEDFVNAELPLRIGTVEVTPPTAGMLPVYKGVGLLTEAKTLAAVATSGSYNDLSGKPTLGTAAATDASAYATAAQGTKADSALQPASMLYSFNPQTETTYILVAGDVTASGTVIVTCTNASSITVSLPTPSSIGVTTGSSVNFRQGGAGVITFGGAATLMGKVATAAIYDTVTLVAYNTTTWLRIGG